MAGFFNEMDKAVRDFFNKLDEMIANDDDINADGVQDIVDKINKEYRK